MTSEQSINSLLPERREQIIGWKELASLSTVSAQKVLPYEFCKKHQILPLTVVRGAQDFLTVLSPSTPTLEVGRELRFLAGMEVELETIPVDLLGNAIDAAYLGSQHALTEAVGLVSDNTQKTSVKIISEALSSNAPIPKLLETILSRGLALEASDIHLEYSGTNSRLRYRIDGRLKEEAIDALSIDVVSQLMRRIKILSGIDILEICKPADGSFEFKVQSFCCALRVSAIPIIEGEKLVLRYLDNSKSTPLTTLGLSEYQLTQLKAALATDAGCVLLSGPTGSGKTTLLYSALEYLKNPELNIVTIEDPVEKRLKGISQSQVDRNNGLGFAELLKSLLRQDPDVIMIGEVREPITAETALNASLTGHLVLSTVHASNVFEIILRMRQLVSDRDLLTRPLRLLSSQRLIPKNCKACTRTAKIPSSVRKFLGVSPSIELFESITCSLCNQTGTKGRIGVYEFLPVTESIKEALLLELPTKELLPLARDAGYLPYQFSVREHLISGIISPKEALRALGFPAELCK